MVFSPAFTFASGFPLGFWPRAGLRLQTLRKFQTFWASSARQSSAGSYGVGSAAPVLPMVFQASGSNPALKPTRLRRAAYLIR